jgi:hypothetical protein
MCSAEPCTYHQRKDEGGCVSSLPGCHAARGRSGHICIILLSASGAGCQSRWRQHVDLNRPVHGEEGKGQGLLVMRHQIRLNVRLFHLCTGRPTWETAALLAPTLCRQPPPWCHAESPNMARGGWIAYLKIYKITRAIWLVWQIAKCKLALALQGLQATYPTILVTIITMHTIG